MGQFALMTILLQALLVVSRLLSLVLRAKHPLRIAI